MAGRKRFTERYNLPTARAAAPALQPFPKYPDYQGQQLRDALATERLNQIPLQNAAREAQIAHARASEAEVRVRIRKQINTDNQKAAFYDGLQELESNLDARGMPIGSKGHSEAFAAYAHEFPLARSTKSVQDYLKLHSSVHDDQAALQARTEMALKAGVEAGKAQGIDARVKGFGITKSGEPSVQFSPQDQGGPDFEDQLYKGYKLTPEQFASHVNAKLVNSKGEGDNAGNIITFQAGEGQQGKMMDHAMSVPEFNRFATAYNMPTVTPQATPAPVSGVQAATNYGQQVGAQPDITPAPVVQPSATPDQTPIYTPSPSPEATATPPPLADIFADQPQTP